MVEEVDVKFVKYAADTEIQRYFENDFCADYFLEKLIPAEDKKRYAEKVKMFSENEKMIGVLELHNKDKSTLSAPKNAIGAWTWLDYTYDELPF